MNENLLAGFTPLSTEKWIELLNKELKGKDYKDSLIWHTREGFSLEPFYNTSSEAGSPGVYPYRRTRNTQSQQWEIDQEIQISAMPEEANKSALKALDSGASSITFCGTISSKNEMKSLLKDIGIQFIEVRFRGMNNPTEVYQWYAELFEQTGADSQAMRGAVENDPISQGLLNGGFGEYHAHSVTKLAKERKANQGRFRTVTINASIYHNAGATTVQELAFALAHGHEYLNALVNAGLTIDDAASHIEFRFASSVDFYFSLAKNRAFRELWANVIKAYQPKHSCSHNAFIIGETSGLFQSHQDPYSNLLRFTTEAFAGIAGGCDAFSIAAFDGTNSDFSTRMGRNIQLLLREESHLDKIVDPAGGSFFVEELTQQLIQFAWEKFRSIEKDGGILNYIVTGKLVEECSFSAEQLRSDFRSKKIRMIGVNVYPDPQKKKADLTSKIPASLKEFKALECFRISETEIPASV
ncbi:MAG TPA: methylmalonyl-CoA mutase family protein [Flavobacteriales bacterium]|nr:methylmalonyl-CoA mutase family protein [Flavobacteriales bacterium]HRJ35446.1 methylmalonyl-CoA mutase family protein [Flavobacteriales bacterium]HRJ40074.1 methylmalonyl-CoA mutase family protein [Flavobacteriales bacterium]